MAGRSAEGGGGGRSAEGGGGGGAVGAGGGGGGGGGGEGGEGGEGGGGLGTHWKPPNTSERLETRTKGSQVGTVAETRTRAGSEGDGGDDVEWRGEVWAHIGSLSTLL